MQFTIQGTVPSLKNSKQIFRTKDGRPFITSSKQSKQWHHSASVDILRQRLQPLHIDEEHPVRLQMVFYNHDKRRRDIDNQTSTVMDLIKDAGLIPDDNCFIVRQVIGIFGGVDNDNPRCEIDISHI